MKLKHLLGIVTLFFFSELQAQEQLKYSFSVDENNIETVKNIINESLGASNSTKKDKVYWLDKTSNSKYKVCVKGRKVRLFYKGKDNKVESDIKTLYARIKDK